jgi:hypothetical protein
MSTRAARHPSRPGWVLILAASAVALGACSGPPGGAGPSATPVTAPTQSLAAATPEPTASAQPSSPAAEASASVAPAASGGPVDYAAWVERQGFGGSSGLHQLLNDVKFLQANGYAATLFDVDDGAKLADHLATWLDRNPPTACWTDYHAAIRSDLGKIHDNFVLAHDNVAGGHSIPADVATKLVTEVQAAYEMAAPAAC